MNVVDLVEGKEDHEFRNGLLQSFVWHVKHFHGRLSFALALSQFVFPAAIAPPKGCMSDATAK
jgi:hypothetical protein